MRIAHIFACTWPLLMSACNESDSELSSPEKTVLAYCRGATHDVQSKYFAIESSIRLKGPKSELPWNTCDVVSVAKTSLAGKRMEERVVLDSDIEVTTRVRYADEQFGEGKLWYLLRRFGEDWKIIAYTSMDEPEFAED